MAEAPSFVDAAISANRDNFILKASAWAEADPLFSVRELDGATAVFSGSSTDTFNVLALTRDSKRSAVDIIEEARNTLFGDNRFSVWSWQDGQLQTLPVDKTAIEENLIMVCDKEDFKAASKTQGKFVTTPASDPAHLGDIGVVLASVFGEQEEGFMIQSVFAGQDESAIEKLAVRFLLAYTDGNPAAAGSYILDGSVAGIYDIAVLPDQQKKGVGSRMFDAVARKAIAKGAQSFTLQASIDGASIYERAGFQTLGVCWCLDIS